LPTAVAVLALLMGYLFTRAVEVTPDAWLAQYNNTWSDWSFHASDTTAFVFGHNLPPQNPIFAGTPFRYPFAPDFASALLVGGGWSIPAALIWPSWAMTLLALSGLILWARGLTGGIAAGVIAVTLTRHGGGLGYWFFFGDAALTGLLPLFHVHSLVVVGIVAACWALLFPRPAWIGFFALMLLLAVPRLLMAVPGDPGAPPEHQYPRWLIGWMSGADVPAWFWIKNTGLFIPLLLLALLSPLALRGRARLLIAPFSLVFIVANLVKFQPWDWDNSKLLVFWYMASGVAVGAMLVRFWRSQAFGAIGASVIWLSLVASGVLSLMQFLPP